MRKPEYQVVLMKAAKLQHHQLLVNNWTLRITKRIKETMKPTNMKPGKVMLENKIVCHLWKVKNPIVLIMEERMTHG